MLGCWGVRLFRAYLVLGVGLRMFCGWSGGFKVSGFTGLECWFIRAQRFRVEYRSRSSDNSYQAIYPEPQSISSGP